MNPALNNQFRTPDETAKACVDYWKPLIPYFSEGKGRVSLGKTGAHFTVAAAEFEGFSRPLFGLAPLCAGGRDFEGREMFLEGLANGSNPDHPDFWGWPPDHDQRLVESAAIGFTLAMAPEAFWDPLPGKAKDTLATWLHHCQSSKVHGNNWHFFHVLGSLGLERVGIQHDMGVRENALEQLESWYQDRGWYSDGANRHFDHYIGFAMHFYGLLYSALAKGDAERCERFRDRAALFAQDFKHWTDDEGATVAYGRSMTYRFAQAAFWSALPMAGVEAPSHGAAKSLWASNMRWWAARDWGDRDGVMPVGYLYPNLMMSESYNSPGSPYWAMKSFLPLALSDDHPFWTEEEAPQERPAVAQITQPGMLALAEKGNTVILSSGSDCQMPHRAVAEKYAKFAYSSAYGFSVDVDSGSFALCPHDNMLVFSDNGWQFYPRVGNEDAYISDDLLWSRWSPCEGATVETWMLPATPWHIRIHKITATRGFDTVEGGFAIPRTDEAPELSEEGQGFARVTKDGHAAAAIDLAFDGATQRLGHVRRALPNSSLYFPQTHVPQLIGRVEPGETWFAAAFLGSPNGQTEPPAAPDKATLQALLDKAMRVPGLKYTEQERPRW